MASYNAEHTFVATPVQLDQNAAGSFATAASHFIATSTPSNVMLSNNGGGNSLHRAAVTSNSTSSSYTFLQIKREPCQVSEVTTSNHQPNHQQQQLATATHHQQQQRGACSASSSTSISATSGSKTVSASALTTLVKIEPPSPKVPDLLDKGSATAASALGVNTSNSVPIGIAVARKRHQETSTNTLASCNSAAIPLSQTFSKDLNCFGFRVADLGGNGCGNIFFTGNGDLMTGSAAATAEELALQGVSRTPSTIWQYPSAALPFESVISMSPATVGLQYSREASRAGQVVLLPAATATALGISNIPPLCYTPTDPFQQAAAAAALVWPSAYLPQNTATAPPTAATLQSPHNFLFPTMNSAHTAAAAAAATIQPQSYAAAASLQLFGSSYLRNATEFMAAAGKTTSNTQQNHLITGATAGATPTTLNMPSTTVAGTATLNFETRDKTTMTATTTTNLLELQNNTQAALNLIRLPTPPTSATIGDGAASQLHTTSQILFQGTSPAPTLLNLSTTGPNPAARTLSRHQAVAAPSANSNITASSDFLSNATVAGPPTPLCDEPSTTTTPLALNFKIATAVTDAVTNSSIVVGVPRALASVQPSTATGVLLQPQMQDVNIQTDTPVCSEDENSTCPLAMLQQQTAQFIPPTAVSGDACLTPPPYNCTVNQEKAHVGNEDITEPLELTKTRNCSNNTGGSNEADEVQPHVTNSMCHNEKNEGNNSTTDPGEDAVAKKVGGKFECESYVFIGDKAHRYESEHEQQPVEHEPGSSESTIPSSGNISLSQAQSTADDFAGLELLSNISASSLPNKPAPEPLARGSNTSNLTTSATMLRVKQEPLDAMDDQLQQEMLILPTIAAKVEHNRSTAARNGPYERPLVSPQKSNMVLETPTTQPPVLEPPSATEPLGGLNLLCALAEQRIQEEEEEQGSNFFASTSTSQPVTTPSSFIPFQQQRDSFQNQSPFRSEQTSFPSMESIELPTTSGVDLTAAVSSPTPPTPHVKRKKHKHSKSSKSSKSSTSASAVALPNGVVSPSLLCGGKISKRSSKKNKKKYSKEKKRQQRPEAVAVANELDFDDEQLQEELQKAFISGTHNMSGSRNGSSNVKWPSAQEIFNIMESRMRQRLADITRQYRKKKRKLDEISKTQRKRKKCSKLIAQQLQQQMALQQQQNLLSSPLTAATLSLNGNATTSISDYKFATKKFMTPASAGPSSTVTHSPYLQPSSFPLRFPPLSASTADEDSDKNSHSRTNKKTPIYKPVRLEPSSLSAAMVTNGATNNNNNNGIGNGSGTNNNYNNNNSSSTNVNDQINYNLNTALRLALKHSSSETPALPLNSKERKLMPKEKTNRRSLVDGKESMIKINKGKSAKVPAASNALSAPTEQQRQRSETDLELTLTNEHLYRKETRVLTDMGGLFYAGIMKPLQPPDIYAITLDGERGNKPHIMSREEIFKDTILEVAPKNVDCVPVGTRLCAYWSQQYRCLYPGRAIESESSEGDDLSAEKDFVSVEFDDGDSGRIRLQNIRFLLSDYPIVEYNDNPLYSLGKQKKSVLKSGNHIGTSSAGLDSNSTGQLFDTKLGQPSPLNLTVRGDDTEMYARRTEKRRLKKSTKMKSQTGKIPLGSVSNNVNGIPTTLTSSTTTESTDKNRKHHKHKKHKKHKKHRKGEDSSDKSFTMHTNGDVNDVEADQSANLQVQRVEQNHQHHQISTQPDASVKPIKLESNNALGSVRVKTEQLDIEEESASNMMSENSDEVKGDEDDEIEHNNSKGSKIAAFLPERQLWGWLGTAYRKAGVKGRARKQFYKTIKRGKELITVGDCAVFLSTGRPDRPYIGRIESMWETSSSNKVVRVRWFYHPEETTGCPSLKYPGALFESPHEDENDVQTISHRCEVLPFERYFDKFGADAKQYQSIYDNNDTYYLAGYYNPRVKTLTLQENIPTTTAMTAITIASSPMSGSKVNKGGEKKHTNTSTGTSIP